MVKSLWVLAEGTCCSCSLFKYTSRLLLDQHFRVDLPKYWCDLYLDIYACHANRYNGTMTFKHILQKQLASNRCIIFYIDLIGLCMVMSKEMIRTNSNARQWKGQPVFYLFFGPSPLASHDKLWRAPVAH